MTSVSLSNLHPDFKLGFLLAVAASLLAAGSTDGFWCVVTSERLGVEASDFGWITLSGGLGGLLVVAAVIWVDSRPPHVVMSAGSLVLAIGLALLFLSDALVIAVPAAFVAGGAAVGSMIFYSVVVKGQTRFKGTLIGVLSLLFSLRWDLVGVNSSWEAGFPIGWVAVILALASGTLILLFLPRCFTGPYGTSQPLRKTMALPGARVLAFWVAAVYVVGTTIRLRGTTYLHSITLTTSQGSTDLELGYQITALVLGIGALLWGISADHFPVRRLLMALVALSLPAAALLFLPDWQAVGMLFMWLVLGGLISLPWVLMAESLPRHHFAKIALAIIWLGSLGLSLEALLFGWPLTVGYRIGFFWFFGAELIVLAALIAFRPGAPRTAG